MAQACRSPIPSPEPRSPKHGHCVLTAARQRWAEGGYSSAVHQVLQYMRRTSNGPRLNEANSLLKAMARQVAQGEVPLSSNSVAPEDLSSLGSALKALCVYEPAALTQPAIQCLTDVVALNPCVPLAWAELGELLQSGGSLFEAQMCWLEAIKLDSANPLHWCSLAHLVHRYGHAHTAASIYTEAIARAPNHAPAYTALADLYQDLGQFEQATGCYRSALMLDPYNPVVHANVAALHFKMGDVNQCLRMYERALELDPNFFDASHHMGCVLEGIGRFNEGIVAFHRCFTMPGADIAAVSASLHRTITACPILLAAANAAYQQCPEGGDVVWVRAGVAEAYVQLGLAFRDNHAQALHHYREALAVHPESCDALANLVHLMQFVSSWTGWRDLFGRLRQMLKRQFAQPGVLPSVQPFHALCYPLDPEEVMGIAVRYAARAAAVAEGLRLADPSLQFQHTKSAPRRKPLQLTLAAGAAARGQQSGVARPAARKSKGHHARGTAEPKTPGLTPSHRRDPLVLGSPAQAAAAETGVLAAHATPLLPDPVLPPLVNEPVCAVPAPSLPPGMSTKLVLNLSSDQLPPPGGPQESSTSVLPTLCEAGDDFLAPRLRVGYVSSDFGNHPLSHLMCSVFELHDRRSFEVFCYALSESDHTNWRSQIESGAEHFRDLHRANDAEAARIIHGDGIDVLINLNGYTKGARTEIFALRPAPVQMLYMGFPATMGASYIDYLITDEVTSPASLEHLYTEKLLRMPHSYFVNDHRQSMPEVLAAGTESPSDRAVERTALGLPPNAFVFCNFCQLYKVDPRTLDAWCRILLRCERSVLWLLRFPPLAEESILREVQVRGVPPSRLIFTDVAGKTDYVMRGRLADLCLDTPLCNGHTTSCDVLWAGVPVLTMARDTMASRVAASLVMALGVNELVCESMVEYEHRAVGLARDPQRMLALRQQVERARSTAPLFDTKWWVADIECCYHAAWERHAAGHKPAHTNVTWTPQLGYKVEYQDTAASPVVPPIPAMPAVQPTPTQVQPAPAQVQPAPAQVQPVPAQVQPVPVQVTTATPLVPTGYPAGGVQQLPSHQLLGAWPMHNFVQAPNHHPDTNLEYLHAPPAGPVNTDPTGLPAGNIPLPAVNTVMLGANTAMSGASTAMPVTAFPDLWGTRMDGQSGAWPFPSAVPVDHSYTLFNHRR